LFNIVVGISLPVRKAARMPIGEIGAMTASLNLNDYDE
jgi:hypothetical protein